jgi:crotonobetainyl-CoA:carnitine CoA-transferase CaiB-like acyl-CoA transferase
VRGPAPRFGEHTREVLAERCQISDEELAQFEADGVIASSR